MKLQIGDIALEAVRYGDASRPAVLGVMGTMEGHNLWPTPVRDAVVAAGFQFIAFDPRDIGESTHHDERPDLAAAATALMEGRLPDAPYDLVDLADDAAALLEALAIERAHVVGYSLGGVVAQLLAIHHPKRVASLVPLMTTSREPGLSDPAPEAAAALMSIGEPGLDRAEACRRIVALADRIAGPGYPTSAAEHRAFAEAIVSRGFESAAVGRQALALYGTPPHWERLSELRIPVTVIHGSDDCFFGVDHAEALGKRIPDARVEILEGAGHDLAAALAPKLAKRIVGHLARVSAS